MPNGGSLAIKVSKLRQCGSSVPQGVRVTVLDTGTGISREEQKHLFEAFFTTKADVGTGLGLWVTKNIVEKHGGTIRFKSKVGRGTVFSIVLPLYNAPVDKERRDLSQHEATPALR
jgi:signal transduction histidine kinase